MGIKTRKKAGSGRPASPRVIKVGEAEPIFGKGINIGCFQLFGPIASQVGMTHVIDQDKNDIGLLRWVAAG